MFNPNQYVKPNVTKDDVLQLKKAFDTIDLDHNNSISPLEIRAFFQRLELQDSKDAIYDMLKVMDDDYSGGVDFDEFFNFLTEIFDEKEKREEIRRLLKRGVDVASKPVAAPKQEASKKETASNSKPEANKKAEPKQKEAAMTREKQKKEVLRSKQPKAGNKGGENKGDTSVTEGFNPDPYVSATASRETVMDLKKAFDLLDDDKSGMVSPAEITKYFEQLGLMTKNKLIYQVLAEMDADNSGGIDFEEFVKFVTSRVSDKDTNLKDEIARIFAFFDSNNDGKVTWTELKSVAQFLGEEMTDDEIKEMFVKADLDDDGFVNVDDFYNIWTGKGYY